jgi:putative PIN family toxin of toxin-antitoxin system
MNYPKLNFTEEQKTKFLEILFEVSHIVDTKLELNIIKNDPTDNMLLECAIESGANYIISGDSHLKELKEFKGIKILPVAKFLELNP